MDDYWIDASKHIGVPKNLHKLVKCDDLILLFLACAEVPTPEAKET